MDSVYEEMPVSFCRLTYGKLTACLMEISDSDLF